jgi:hypothetical protein
VTDINLEPLSKRARALAGVWFGMMRPDSCSGVTMNLRELKPTEITQAAIDELLAAGIISKEPFNEYGGIVYKPLVDCWPAFIWMGANLEDPEVKFQLMEPV